MHALGVTVGGGGGGVNLAADYAWTGQHTFEKDILRTFDMWNINFPSDVFSVLPQKNIYGMMIPTGADGASAISTFGGVIGTSGTLTGSKTEAGICVNNNMTAAANAYFLNQQLTLFRGSTLGLNGFFLHSILNFPDASYNQSGATTGTRIWVGLTTQGASATTSDNPSGNRCGFSRLHTDSGAQNTNWFFSTKDGTTENRQDTGLAFTVACEYEFIIYCPPQGSTIYFYIRNITLGTEGNVFSVTSNLPAGSAAMGYVAEMTSLNAVSRNFRFCGAHWFTRRL